MRCLVESKYVSQAYMVRGSAVFNAVAGKPGGLAKPFGELTHGTSGLK
ncbi:hypothetical protein CLV24_109106 [Pontibacter ummariensis]|uniref:Uncharacterized protein n=1 Tax=Pontibacter ummariensis TaxID=1610492 RepID=A0A239FR90_9BACT|nr:hypothetical protein CLV24_109106 [Pontibacter ummariensis]SNS58743.1 hypothetical protein SAMN06296052_10964 [Pontibacter ummariensis]